MANTVRLVIEGQDVSGAAFSSASKNAQLFSRTVTASMGQAGIAAHALSQSFSSFSALANTTFMSVAESVALSITQLRALSATAQTTGLTLQASLGVFALGAAAGAAIMGKVIEKQEAATAAAAAGAEAAGKMFAEAGLAMLQMEDARAGAIAKINAGIDEQIRQAEKLKITEQDRVQLYETLDALRANQVKKFEAEDTQKIIDFERQLMQVRLSAQDAHLAAEHAEEVRHQNALKRINEEVTNEQTKNQLLLSEKAAYDARVAQLEEQAAQRAVQIKQEQARREQQIRQATMAATASLFSSLSGLAQAQGKKGFAAAQAFRYAETIVHTAAAIMRAWADFGFPAAIPIAALVAAQGAVQLATIASAKPPSGQAHAGLTNVPQDATYILRQNERVLAPTQNADLTEFLDGAGGGRMMHVSINLDGRTLGEGVGQLSRDGRLVIDARSVQ